MEYWSDGSDGNQERPCSTRGSDPIDATAFRMDRVVMEPEHIAHLVQELRGLRLTFHFGLLVFGDECGFAPIIDPGLFDLD